MRWEGTMDVDGGASEPADFILASVLQALREDGN